MLSRAGALALVAGLVACPPTTAAEFSKLIVFGDSLVDSGNFHAATSSQLPALPYFAGRFSNGPVAVEVLARLAGLAPPLPSDQGGTNHAWAGARAGDDIDLRVLVIPSVRTQVSRFLDAATDTLDSHALYVVTAGGNDIMGAVESNDQIAEPAIRTAAGHHAAAVDALLDRGAVHLLVILAPDVSRTPGHWKSADARRLAKAYNHTLESALDSLDVPTMRRFDLSTVIGETANLVVDRPCYTPPDICSDPDAHFFWDGTHPSAAGHELLATEMWRLLRLPTTLLTVSWSRVKESILQRQPAASAYANADR